MGNCRPNVDKFQRYGNTHHTATAFAVFTPHRSVEFAADHGIGYVKTQSGAHSPLVGDHGLEQLVHNAVADAGAPVFNDDVQIMQIDSYTLKIINAEN